MEEKALEVAIGEPERSRGPLCGMFPRGCEPALGSVGVGAVLSCVR